MCQGNGSGEKMSPGNVSRKWVREKMSPGNESRKWVQVMGPGKNFLH